MSEAVYDENKWAEIHEAINKVAEAIVELFNKVKEVVVSVFNSLVDVFRDTLHRVDPKLFNLAYRHPKRRVRKKNLRRLLKMLRLEI